MREKAGEFFSNFIDVRGMIVEEPPLPERRNIQAKHSPRQSRFLRAPARGRAAPALIAKGGLTAAFCDRNILIFGPWLFFRM